MTDESRVYPLAANQSEGERLDAQNVSIKAILGTNPVHPALRLALEARIQDGQTINVLDIATGTGVFARDLVEAYPQANFRILLADVTDKFLLESGKNRGEDAIPKLSTFETWDLHSDEVPAAVEAFAPDGFDLINARFLLIVLRVNEWDFFLKRIKTMLAPSTGLLQLTEATHTWCVQDDYELDRSLPPFDCYPYDPVDLARNRGTFNCDNTYHVDRLGALTLVSKLKAAGFEADGISSIPFAVPNGKELTPSRPLVASSRLTKAGSAPGSIPEENNALAELEDGVDYFAYANLPGPVETDEGKLREAKVNAMNNGRNIMTMLSQNPRKFGVAGFRTEDEVAKWKEAADAWLEHHTYFHPCMHVAWQPLRRH
ncbi:hypothetical protein OC845_001563 [Tilletia horrida]|nr:hypothetical protein OC845_001563 [Tilletia horrida]